jgi:hypothetical protein
MHCAFTCSKWRTLLKALRTQQAICVISIQQVTETAREVGFTATLHTACLQCVRARACACVRACVCNHVASLPCYTQRVYNVLCNHVTSLPCYT